MRWGRTTEPAKELSGALVGEEPKASVCRGPRSDTTSSHSAQREGIVSGKER